MSSIYEVSNRRNSCAASSSNEATPQRASTLAEKRVSEDRPGNRTIKDTKYRIDPRIIKAHRDYQRWLNLSDIERDKTGIQGDVLMHFFRKHAVP